MKVATYMYIVFSQSKRRYQTFCKRKNPSRAIIHSIQFYSCIESGEYGDSSESVSSAGSGESGNCVEFSYSFDSGNLGESGNSYEFVESGDSGQSCDFGEFGDSS